MEHETKSNGHIVRLLEDVRKRIATLESTRSSRPAGVPGADEAVGPGSDVIRAMPAGLLFFEYLPPNGLTLTDANLEAWRLIGVNAHQQRGEELDALWPNAREQRLYDVFIKTMETGLTAEIDGAEFRRDGSAKQLRLRAFRLAGDRLGMVLEDVTSRKRLEEEVSRLRGETDALAEDRIEELEEANRRLQEQIIEQERLIDALRSTVSELAFHEQRLSEDLRQSREDLKAEVKDRIEAQEEARRLREGPASAPASREVVSETTEEDLRKEIEERRRAEVMREQTEARYRLLVQHSPVGVISCDMNGAITEINPKALDILGLHSVQHAKAINMLTFPSFVELKVSRAVHRCLETGETKPRELRFITSEGKRAHVRLNMAPIRDAAGSIDGALLVIEDISEYRKNEELRMRSERLKAVGRMSYSLAESFSKLLADVAERAQTALRNVENDNFSGIKPLLDQIHLCAIEASDQLRPLQQLALANPRRISSTWTVFDLNDAVRKGIEENRLRSRLDQKRKDVDYSLHLDLHSGAYIGGEMDAMVDVVVNLLRNAEEAMPDGGAITVKTAKEDGQVVLQVSDHGTGIRKRDLGKVFEPFWTTKEGHSGMGLAVALGIIHRHGGTITVRSKKREGTTLTARLP